MFEISTNKNILIGNENYSIYEDATIIGIEALDPSEEFSKKMTGSYKKKHNDSNAPSYEEVNQILKKYVPEYIKKSMDGYKAYLDFFKKDLPKQLNVFKGQMVKAFPSTMSKQTYTNAVIGFLYKSIIDENVSKKMFDTEKHFKNPNFNNVMHVTTGKHLTHKDNPDIGAGGTMTILFKKDFDTKNYGDFKLETTNDKMIMPIFKFKKSKEQYSLLIDCNINTKITTSDAKKLTTIFKTAYNAAKKTKFEKLNNET